jgi:hypothetical protein
MRLEPRESLRNYEGRLLLIVTGRLKTGSRSFSHARFRSKILNLYLTKSNYVFLKKNPTDTDCYMRLMTTYTWGILGRQLLPYQVPVLEVAQHEGARHIVLRHHRLHVR